MGPGVGQMGSPSLPCAGLRVCAGSGAPSRERPREMRPSEPPAVRLTPPGFSTGTEGLCGPWAGASVLHTCGSRRSHLTLAGVVGGLCLWAPLLPQGPLPGRGRRAGGKTPSLPPNLLDTQDDGGCLEKCQAQHARPSRLGMGERAGPGAPSAAHRGLVQMPPSQPRPGPEPGGEAWAGGASASRRGGSQRTTTGRNVRAGMGLLRSVPRFSHMSWAALVQFMPMGLLFHFILLLGYFTLAGGVIPPTLSS